MVSDLTTSTRSVIDQFNEAFNQHDVDAIMELMTDDCVFENTTPPPNGERFVGADAVRAFMTRFFKDTPSTRYEAEDVMVDDDRAVVRWTHHFQNEDGESSVKGVDIFRIRDGKVCEKLSYIKE
jgi:uncharacterized protein (TIGR02246 family)